MVRRFGPVAQRDPETERRRSSGSQNTKTPVFPDAPTERVQMPRMSHARGGDSLVADHPTQAAGQGGPKLGLAHPAVEVVEFHRSGASGLGAAPDERQKLIGGWRRTALRIPQWRATSEIR